MKVQLIEHFSSLDPCVTNQGSVRLLSLAGSNFDTVIRAHSWSQPVKEGLLYPHVWLLGSSATAGADG